jgi:membrane-associated protein
MRSPRASISSSGAFLALPVALPHATHGSPLDYAAICLAAALTWFGLPGAGEAALIAGSLLAAQHHLDIGLVIGAAAAGAAAGGIVGWIVGMKASRPLAIGRGPFLQARRRLVARGELFFERHGPLGVFIAPSWAAGLHNMPARRFIPLNTAMGIAWAAGYGAVAFLLGPAVAAEIRHYGALIPIAAAVLLVAFLILRRLRRRRRGAEAKFLHRPKFWLREG